MNWRHLCLATIAAMSALGTATAGEQFTDKNGIANFGYDVVAYHTTFQPTEGTNQYTANYNGATFWFASAENRDLFLGNPAAFAPAYDGHCAFALTSHKKLLVDPEAFSIVDPETGQQVDPSTYVPGEGILYLNYDPGVNQKFNKDLAANIAKADFAWIDCLENKPAAVPKKRFNDLFSGGRPNSCPAG
ncbi:YHS domain-containing (seleno)protein [Hyphomonas sp.]|uniref:YHS domain-containing (seleno)protein n=1 Tax=Hyphomonas sp. TaxID=87 RepID=UPI003528DA2A